MILKEIIEITLGGTLAISGTKARQNTSMHGILSQSVFIEPVFHIGIGKYFTWIIFGVYHEK